MKLEKIVSEIAKAFYKGSDIYYRDEGDYTFITTDGIVGYFLHKSENIFDLNNFKEFKFSFKDDGCVDGHRTNELKLLDKGVKATKIVSGDILVWINSKHLNNFDGVISLKIKQYNTPVYVYEGEILRGIIMPMRVTEGN